MRFKSSKEVLMSAIQTVEGAVATKTTLPILSNVLIEGQNNRLHFNATDLDIGIIYKADAEIIDAGNITIPAKRFADIIKELPSGDITINVKKNYNMLIDCSSCSFRLIGLPKEEFPSIPKFNNKEGIVIEQAILKKLLKKVSFAMSKDETRYVLNGTLFMFKNKTLRLVATDGRRLAMAESKLSSDINKKDAIIPVKTITELSKILKEEGTVRIIFLDNQVAFELDETMIISRLIEGEFPNYEQVIPKEKQEKIKIDKNHFMVAVKRASLFTSLDSQSIKLDVFKNKIVVSKITPDIGEVKEEIKTEYTGNDLTVGFNPVYLLDVLKTLQSDSIDIEIADAEKPAVFREQLADLNGYYVYIVLPMQLA